MPMSNQDDKVDEPIPDRSFNIRLGQGYEDFLGYLRSEKVVSYTSGAYTDFVDSQTMGSSYLEDSRGYGSLGREYGLRQIPESPEIRSIIKQYEKLLEYNQQQVKLLMEIREAQTKSLATTEAVDNRLIAVDRKLSLGFETVMHLVKHSPLSTVKLISVFAFISSCIGLVLGKLIGRVVIDPILGLVIILVSVGFYFAAIAPAKWR